MDDRTPSPLPVEPATARSPLDDLLAPAPRRRSRWRKAALVTLLLALGAGGYALYRTYGGGAAAPVSYSTEPLARGRIESQVTATGTLSALVTVQVGSQVSGRIQELYADYNSEVKKGQVIARIDPEVLKTDVTRARANLTSARAGLQKAEAAAHEAKLKYERDRGLAAQNIVAPATVETLEATHRSTVAQVASARADVAVAQAALEAAQVKLAYTTIVSPIDGLVVSRSVDVGQTVAASLQAPVLFTIAEDLRQMEVHTDVAESDVGQLREGMAVRFSVDAYPNESFDGRVKQVRYEAQTTQNVVTYDAVISVRNDQLKLRPGMTANVIFIVAARDDVLLLPNAALRFRPPASASAGNDGPSWSKRGSPGAGAAQKAGASAAARSGGGAARARGKRPKLVFVLGADGKPRRVVVRTGISDGSRTELVSGQLKAGDPVIVGIGTGSAGGAQPAGGAPQSKRRRGPPRIL